MIIQTTLFHLPCGSILESWKTNFNSGIKISFSENEALFFALEVGDELVGFLCFFGDFNPSTLLDIILFLYKYHTLNVPNIW